MKISQLGERSIIERISAIAGRPASPGVEGIGDDCAVLPLSATESLLITTDLLAGGVHFLSDDIPPRDLGWKSLAVNLSDVAAMGGRPLFALLSIALPPATETAWLEGFLEGFSSLLNAHGVSLIGGDTTRSQNDPFINVTVLGEIETARIKRRSAARPGDKLCLSGPIGDSRAGLLIVLRRLAREGAAAALVQRHYHPEPAVHEGAFLGEHPAVHAMMDLSDGLLSDLPLLTAASGCGAGIEVERLPLSRELLTAAPGLGIGAADIAIAGGEDYRLLFSVAPDAAADLCARFERHFGVPPAVIGQCTDAPDVRYTLRGEPYSPKDPGFQHFETGH